MLMSRVDIVTGGASAVYGSDAVAGVVNFILDKKFTGFKYDINAASRNMPTPRKRALALPGVPTVRRPRSLRNVAAAFSNRT
jgi:outer membrane receptor protein involved in Fe transport